MRLLNVDDLRVYEFNDEESRPAYAILSHTWEQGEVSFQNIHTPEAKSMAGYTKIRKCCEIAKQDGFKYVWIDTCCIDKTSSAEFSEAINSMFMWYKSASVCYAFLADFPPVESADLKDEDMPDLSNQLRYNCRWFKRGWTLQELLAPETVVFYSRKWVDIGTKHSLRDVISTATKIPREVLLDASLIQTYNVAARMSWAAKRRTTRLEDRAYSLMGLFGVNMPLLYGEGDRAFRRLQLEIMKDSSDETIFLGPSSPRYENPASIKESDRVDMLSPSVTDFESWGDVKLDDNHLFGPPFAMTNKGLHIWLRCKQISDVLHLAALNCTHEDQESASWRSKFCHLCIVIYLHPNTGDCARVTRDVYNVEMDDWNTVAAPKELYIRQIFGPTGALPNTSEVLPLTVFEFTKNTSPKTGYHLEHLSGGIPSNWTENVRGRTNMLISSSPFDDSTKPAILCSVVKSLQKPNSHALIVVGRISNVGSPISYHYRVFRGSKVPPVLERIAKSHSSAEWKSMFADTFPGDGSLIHYNDRIAKRLNDKCIIRITFRKGPCKHFDFHEQQDFHVHIAFGRGPIEGEEISDADIVPHWMTEG